MLGMAFGSDSVFSVAEVVSVMVVLLFEGNFGGSFFSTDCMQPIRARKDNISYTGMRTFFKEKETIKGPY